jgi:ABC-2 type transport system ATP-binding protein
VEAGAALVGRIAVRHSLVLTELRGADTGGLEELFLELTAADAREVVAA